MKKRPTYMNDSENVDEVRMRTQQPSLSSAISTVSFHFSHVIVYTLQIISMNIYNK